MVPSHFKPKRSFTWLIIPVVLLVLVAWWETASKGERATKTESEGAVHSAEFVSGVFSEWAQEYELATEGERSDLLERGIAMARERRAWLAELIQSDPEAALAAAISRAEREQLPAEIAEHMEEFVSASAPLDVMHGCFHPEGCEHAHDNEFYRATVIDGREYRVHVYGDRLKELSLPETSLHGIALDGHLALRDSRVRILEPGETLPVGTRQPLPGEVAVEANGEVTFLASMGAVKIFENAIRNDENSLVGYANDSGDGTSTISSRPSQAWANGDKKLLVIIVDFDDVPGRPVQASYEGILAPGEPVTEEDVHELINGANGVREFYQDGSYGKTDLLLAPTVNGDSPDVTEVLRMPSDAASYALSNSTSTLGTDAKTAASNAGYDVDAYDRVCILFSYLGPSTITGSKFTFGGRASTRGSMSYINGYWDFRVIAHELGHNWGLRHANLWKVTDGNPGSMATGTSQAYGDSHDTMGSASGSPTKHFSHWAKSLLWWIPDSSVTTADTSGTYRVYRFDGIGANLNQPRAVKIVRDDTRDYWIGYRRAGTLGSMADRAYVLWGYNTGYDEGDLLDMNTPGSDVKDAGLAIGQTYEDPEKGISFTPIAQGGSGADEWLDIQVTFTSGWPAAYSEWWTGQNIENSSFTQIAPTDNSDRDNLTNMQEFAFGLDPTTFSSTPLSFTTGSDMQAGVPALMKLPVEGQPDAFHAVFSRRKDYVAAGLTYSAQFSADLATWTESSAGMAVESENSAGTMEAVSVPYPDTVPANGGSENLPPRFFRVGVEMP